MTLENVIIAVLIALFLSYLFRNKIPCNHKFDHEQYGSIQRTRIDDIGREHAYVELECVFCHDRFVMAQIHLIPRQAEEELAVKYELLRDTIEKYTCCEL